MDTNNVAFRIHDESCAISDSHRFIQHAIQLGYLAVMIGSDRKLRIQFLGPMIQGSDEIRADGDYLRIRIFKFANTRLVGCKLGRSTSGKGRREECQHHVLLALVIGELECGVIRRGQREIGGLVADLQIRVLPALLYLLSR